MLSSINIQNILFLDIETVPQNPSFEDTPQDIRGLWEKKAKSLLRDSDETAESIYRQAGIYAEFGKIICISCGYFSGPRSFRIKSFSGDDEKALLTAFADLARRFCTGPDRYLCAHNGKEFDFPFLARRLVIQGIPLPPVLDTPGKKPWEVSHLDTMELWKFGDYKSYTSLLLLATVLGIPTPKDDIDGSRVWEVFWNEKNLPRIVRYCQKDVLTVAQILLRFRGEALLTDAEVEIIQA